MFKDLFKRGAFSRPRFGLALGIVLTVVVVFSVIFYFVGVESSVEDLENESFSSYESLEFANPGLNNAFREGDSLIVRSGGNAGFRVPQGEDVWLNVDFQPCQDDDIYLESVINVLGEKHYYNAYLQMPEIKDGFFRLRGTSLEEREEILLFKRVYVLTFSGDSLDFSASPLELDKLEVESQDFVNVNFESKCEGSSVILDLEDRS